MSSLINNKGFVGFLPIIASSMYSLVLIKTDNNLKIKITLIFNLSLWVIYGIYIKDIIGSGVNFIYTVYLIGIVLNQLRENSINKSKLNSIDNIVKRKLTLVKIKNENELVKV